MEIKISTSNTVTLPGAYRIDEAAYHRDPCPAPSLSSSLGRVFLDAAPIHVWEGHPRLNPLWVPKPPKKHLDLGSACHRLLLDAGARIHVIDAPDFKTKAAREARDDALNRGETGILARQYDEALHIVDAARRQVDIPALVAGRGDAEVTIASTEPDGAWLRCRPDWWSEDRLTVVDYKTTSGYASENEFRRQVERLGYDFQDSFYRWVITRVFPELAGKLAFVFVVQETSPPYALATFELSDADRSVADRKVSWAVTQWSQCLAADVWPGYPRGVQRLVLSDWHHRRWLDRELADEGDDGV